jgi:hypothetical protein
MPRVQSPCTRVGRWLTYDARHDSRSRSGRDNRLRSNLSLFSCHFRTHLIYSFFKGLFPSEINQRADNEQFSKYTHRV